MLFPSPPGITKEVHVRRSLSNPFYQACKVSNVKTGNKVIRCRLYIASFPGFSAPERDIEVVHAERAWYFFHMRTLKGREGIERPYLSVGVPETQNREKTEGSGQLTACI